MKPIAKLGVCVIALGAWAGCDPGGNDGSDGSQALGGATGGGGGTSGGATGTAGDTGNPFGGGADCQSAIGTGDPTCDACIDQQCCASAKACENEPTCATCLQNQSQTQECASDGALHDFATCFTVACGAACGVSGDGSGGAGGSSGCEVTLTGNDAACDACIEKGCCDQLTACANEEECMTCADNPSALGCASDATFEAFNACASASCDATCKAGGGGSNSSGCQTGTGDPCDDCVGQSCCTQLQGCENDQTCTTCLNDQDTTGPCATNQALGALLTCFRGACATACATN